MSNIIFGTDGWRGLLGKDVNKQNVGIVAQAFSTYLHKKFPNNDNIKTVVAYDGRESSKDFARLFSRILSGNNITVYLADKTAATPILSFYIKEKNLDAGAIITASHNPPQYNGIKFKGNYGGPFFTEETRKVEELLGKDLIQANDDKVYQIDIRSTYGEHLDKLFNFELIKNSGINILIDSMSGAGQQIIENFLLNHGIISKTIYKFAEADFSGRLAEPIEKNLQPLREELKKGNYSLGIATDGDADRVGVMLENGEWLSSQETILLLAEYYINHKKVGGHIVKTSSVTDKLKQFFETPERKVFDVQVGFKYVCEKMLEEDVAFGCEESGGYGFKNHIPERDGIFSAFLLIEMLAASGYKKLSDYVNEKRKQFGKIYYDRIDLDYDGEDRNEILPYLFNNQPKNAAGFNINSIKEFYGSRKNINGLKFYLGDCRWLLLRSSETEPMIRIYAEGNNDEEVNLLLNYGKELVTQK